MGVWIQWLDVSELLDSWFHNNNKYYSNRSNYCISGGLSSVADL